MQADIHLVLQGTVVGFATFHHFPLNGDFNASTWLEDVCLTWRTDDMPDLTVSNTMVLTFFFSEHLYEEEVLNEMMKMAFAICSEVDRILLFLPSNVPLFAPLLGNFEPIPTLDNVDYTKWVVLCMHAE